MWDPLIQNILFYISVVFVFLYYLSPGVMLYTFYSSQLLKWQELPIAQSFGVIFNCLYWVITGNQTNDDHTVNTILYNSIGLSLGALSAIAIWFAGGKLKSRFLFLFMSFNVIFQISWHISKIDKGKETLGKDGLISSIIASIFNVLMYVFTMQNIFTAWNSRNYQKLPIVSLITGLLSTIFWMFFGFSVTELYIIIPNAIGFAVLLVSSLIYLWFYYTYIPIENEETLQSSNSILEIPSSTDDSALIDRMLE